MLTLDTNVLIYHLNNDPQATERLDEWRRQKSTLIISTVSELEVLSLSALTLSDIAIIDDLLATMNIVPLYSNIARIAADLRRRYRMRTPDAAIAATALFSQSSLVTRNVKHFNDIEELTLQPI